MALVETGGARRAPEGPGRGGPRALLAAHWPAGSVLLLVVASSYRWRTRDVGAAVSGGADLAVLVEVAAYGVVAAGLFSAYAVAPRMRRLPAPLALGCAYVATLVLSVSYAPYPSYAAARAAEACVVLALGAALGARARRGQLHGVAHGYLVLVVASVGYGLSVPSPPVSALQEGRFTWLALHPTVSSTFTAIALVIAAAYVLGDPQHAPRPGPRWPRGAYLLLALVSGGALLASQTRGSVLGAVVGLGAVVLLGRRGRDRVVLALGLSVVGALLLVAGSGLVRDFVVRGEDPAQLATLNSRTDLWRVAWEVVLQSPLYGHGVGAPRGLFYEATGLGGSHNMLVNVVAEVGAVGLAAWSGLVVAVVLQLRRPGAGSDPAAGDDRPLLAGVMAAVLVGGLFYDGPGGVATVSSTWLFVVVGWLTALRREAVTGWRALSWTRPPAAPRRAGARPRR